MHSSLDGNIRFPFSSCVGLIFTAQSIVAMSMKRAWFATCIPMQILSNASGKVGQFTLELIIFFVPPPISIRYMPLTMCPGDVYLVVVPVQETFRSEFIIIRKEKRVCGQNSVGGFCTGFSAHYAQLRNPSSSSRRE